MLSEQAIADILHASRVVSLAGVNPHGPLGLLHVAEIVSRLRQEPTTAITMHDTLSREPRSSAS